MGRGDLEAASQQLQLITIQDGDVVELFTGRHLGAFLQRVEILVGDTEGVGEAFDRLPGRVRDLSVFEFRDIPFAFLGLFLREIRVERAGKLGLRQFRFRPFAFDQAAEGGSECVWHSNSL